MSQRAPHREHAESQLRASLRSVVAVYGAHSRALAAISGEVFALDELSKLQPHIASDAIAAASMHIAAISEFVQPWMSDPEALYIGPAWSGALSAVIQRATQHIAALSALAASEPAAVQSTLTAKATMTRPRLFIGSSTEGKEIAEKIQLGLQYDVDSTIWWQGVFGLTGGTLDSLLTALSSFDFAVLVLTPDDLTSKRNSARNTPRDNVIFELGLFLGRLGRDRTFIVYCRDHVIELPSDLAGVTASTFPERADNNLRAALGSVCTELKDAIKAAPARP